MLEPIFSRVRNRLALLDSSRSVRLRHDKPIATFTFDDFPSSAYRIAGKMLEELNARGTYFASAEFMGQTIDGHEYYTPQLLRQIHDAGHEVGCHAAEHTRLGKKGPTFALETCRRNTESIRSILGMAFSFSSFAYPYGDVSPGVKRAMSTKFDLCRGIRQGANNKTVDLAQIRAISLESRHWNAELILNAIIQASHDRSWVVFMTHDVSKYPTPYGSTPEMIEKTLQAVFDAKIPIRTLRSAALEAISPIVPVS